MPTSWLQVSIKTPPAAQDIISNFLIESGSPGVVVKRGEVLAFFARPIKTSTLKKDIQRFISGTKQIYPGITRRSIRWKVVKERNWNTSWRRFIKSQKVGKSFWIGPPWIAPPHLAERKAIIIEPGMAFGTGTHATTRGCLELLEQVIPSSASGRVTALDVGTGSGILAIALAKLGVGRVWAIDNDPVALKTAKVNVRRNHVQKAVKVIASDVEKMKGTFNIVVANLTAETLSALSATLRRKVAAKGSLVVSGILRPKAKETLSCFASRDLALKGEKRGGSWVTLLLRKRPRTPPRKVRRKI